MHLSAGRRMSVNILLVKYTDITHQKPSKPLRQIESRKKNLFVFCVERGNNTSLRNLVYSSFPLYTPTSLAHDLKISCYSKKLSRVRKTFRSVFSLVHYYFEEKSKIFAWSLVAVENPPARTDTSHTTLIATSAQERNREKGLSGQTWSSPTTLSYSCNLVATKSEQ